MLKYLTTKIEMSLSFLLGAYFHTKDMKPLVSSQVTAINLNAMRYNDKLNKKAHDLFFRKRQKTNYCIHFLFTQNVATHFMSISNKSDVY